MHGTAPHEAESASPAAIEREGMLRFGWGFGAATLVLSLIEMVDAGGVSGRALLGALAITTIFASVGALWTLLGRLIPPGESRRGAMLWGAGLVVAFLLPTWIVLAQDGALIGGEGALRSVVAAAFVAGSLLGGRLLAHALGARTARLAGARCLALFGLLAAGYCAEPYLARASRFEPASLALCVVLAVVPIALATTWRLGRARLPVVRGVAAMGVWACMAGLSVFTIAAFSRLYPHVHLAANVFVALAATVAIAQLLPRARSASTERARVPGVASAMALVAAALAIIVGLRMNETLRFEVFERTPLGHALCYGTQLSLALVPEISPTPLSQMLPTPTPSSELTGAARDPRGIVFLTVDAMRADRFAGPHPAPVAFAWFEAGRRFENARTPYTSTYDCLRSITKGAPFGWDQPVDQPALLDLLRARGYTTAVVNLPAERSRIGVVDHGAVLDGRHVDAREATDLALALLEQLAGEKFFLWLHYFDAHTPLRVPADLDAEADTVDERYDAALTGIDRELARVFERLDAPDLNGRVLTCLFADHGEEQGEHGGRFHNTSVYEELARVPLAVRGPGVAAGVSREPVSLIDLWTTLARAVGHTPLAASPSIDLWPVLLGGPDRDRIINVELDSDDFQRHSAVIQGDWKGIVNVRSRTRELYDLTQDPLETDPRIGGAPVEGAEGDSTPVGDVSPAVQRVLGWTQ